jgi:hypothetical protein
MRHHRRQQGKRGLAWCGGAVNDSVPLLRKRSFSGFPLHAANFRDIAAKLGKMTTKCCEHVVCAEKSMEIKKAHEYCLHELNTFELLYK